MNSILLYPSNLIGTIVPPPSKSIAHRAIICAAMAQDDCLIANVVLSDDIDVTIKGLNELGARCELIEDKLFVSKYVLNEQAHINCGESGSTMRFLIPLAAALGIDSVFEGEGRLPQRTLEIYEDALSSLGVMVNSRGGFLPLELKGKMRGGIINLRGDVSSQFISGLLMALPLTEEGGELIITTDLQSEPYVDITIDVMKCFGVNVIKTQQGYMVKSTEKYISNDFCIEADYSQAAFWLVANELGADIDVQGLNSLSLQGDKQIIDIISDMRKEDKDIVIKAHNIPDLVPIIAVLAASRKGRTIIKNAQRLRLKESDRLLSTAKLLDVLGVSYEAKDDGFIINGQPSFNGGKVDSFCDHRIAMAAAIASIKCSQPLRITNYQCVNKSYVEFFNEFKRLGGKLKL